MFIYWCLFALVAIGALLSQEQEAGYRRPVFLLLAAIPTALMIGLRWKIGPDWEAYLTIFDYTKLFSFSQAVAHAEPGYFTLMWLLDRVDARFTVLNLICGTTLVAGLSSFCARQPNPWLAFVVALPYLVIVIGMSGNRQSLALGLLFFALNAYERGRINRFMVLTVVAALFHGSILLLVPICLLSYTRNMLQAGGLLLVAAVLGFYFFTKTFDIYIGRYSSAEIQSSGTVYRLAMNGLAAVIFLLFKDRFALEQHQKTLWRNISICTLALCVVVVVVPSSTAVDRFLLYLFPLQFFVLSRVPKVLAQNRRASGQMTFAIIAYAAVVQATFLLAGTFASAYVPYRTIFSA